MEEDWRLFGKGDYFKDMVLHWDKWVKPKPTWDHDHCEFCNDMFAEESLIPEVLHEGYTNENNYHWICKQCFADFKDRFNWIVK